MNIKTKVFALLLIIASQWSLAGDVTIGTIDKHGMSISAVYIQPVTMSPMLPGMEEVSDMHLEADISALKDNIYGFDEGDWIPYLQLSFMLTKNDSDWHITGHLMPMLAKDGPHYAANLQLDGPGKYQLTYQINPPPFGGFFRHTDKETGIPKWWKPFALQWEFAFVGTGKRGGY